MIYKLWYYFYRVTGYVRHVLPLDIQIARESVRWLSLRIAGLTLGLI